MAVPKKCRKAKNKNFRISTSNHQRYNTKFTFGYMFWRMPNTMMFVKNSRVPTCQFEDYDRWCLFEAKPLCPVQAFISTNADLRTHSSEIQIKIFNNLHFHIRECIWKCRRLLHFVSLCLGLNVLTHWGRDKWSHLPDDIFKRIFLNANVLISIKISLKFVPKGPINKIPALVQIMAWRRPGAKPFSEPMTVSWPTHICVTRPRCVNNQWSNGRSKCDNQLLN